MRDQRGSLEKQLRDLIQQDDITSTLVTTERADMKVSMSEDLSIVILLICVALLTQTTIPAPLLDPASV